MPQTLRYPAELTVTTYIENKGPHDGEEVTFRIKLVTLTFLFSPLGGASVYQLAAIIPARSAYTAMEIGASVTCFHSCWKRCGTAHAHRVESVGIMGK